MSAKVSLVKQAEGHGAAEWLKERVSSLVLVAFTLWALWAAYSVAGQPFEAVVAWLSSPINAGVLLAALIISLWHMHMGMVVIIEDYLQGGARKACIRLSLVFCLALGAVALICTFMLATGAGPATPGA